MTSEMLALALAGLVIVFGVLLLISLLLTLFRRLDDRWQLREKEEEEAARTREPTIDDTTLVLISAAVSAVVVGRFRVKRIRRLLSPGQKRTPWSVQGRLILLGSHAVRRRGAPR
jgi:hypothetical protein